MHKTPILFLIFNRPDTTAIVFEAIRKAQPKTLYISADGPRAHKAGEKELCEAARKVVEKVDWECDVHTKFSEQNQGCKKNVSESITWFFSEVEEGIIFEDDCVPDESFFTFCETLLEKYKNEERVKMISGNNFQFGKKYGSESYYFSNLPSIWGWATWRRAWNEYDIDMKTYPLFKKNKTIKNFFKDSNIQKFMLGIFEKLYTNKMNTWAGRWIYAIYDNNGVSIVPNVNLVSNIGFNENATHTKSGNILDSIPFENIGVITHPEIIKINETADERSYYTIFHQSLFKKIVGKLKSYL